MSYRGAVAAGHVPPQPPGGGWVRVPTGLGSSPEPASTRLQTQVILLVQWPPPKTFLTYPLFDYLIFLCPCQQEEKAGCRGPTEKASFSARSPAHAFCNPKFLRGQKLGTFDTSKGDRWLNMQPKVCTEKIAEPPCWFSIGP